MGERLSKSRLKVNCNIIRVKISGPVIIAKISKKKDKRTVMKNKNMLKEGNIFIENNIIWQNRKR